VSGQAKCGWMVSRSDEPSNSSPLVSLLFRVYVRAAG
jgi:hypothetical protein